MRQCVTQLPCTPARACTSDCYAAAAKPAYEVQHAVHGTTRLQQCPAPAVPQLLLQTRLRGAIA
jgi:hypothetical protein